MRRLLKMMGFEGELHPKDAIYDLTLMLKKEVTKKTGKMLLVLDDVWYEKTIKAFDIGCPILVTTKNKNTMMRVSSFCTDIKCIDDFGVNEIKELLAKYVKCEPHNLPEVVQNVVFMCKGSPLVASLIGGKMAHAGESEEAWKSFYDKLQSPNGMDTVRKRYCSGDSEKDLSRIVDLCIEPIEKYKEYYLDFLIFVKDIPVPNNVLEILWDKENFEVQEIMFELYHRCFVQLERSEDDDNSYSYVSHDLYLDTLQVEFKDDEKLKRHKKLVDKVLKLIKKKDGTIDLTQLPKGYLPYTIGYHLFYAHEHQMLRKLYLNLYFIEQKIYLTKDVRDILYDYDNYRNCFNEDDDVEAYKSFIQRNYAALAQKKSDIVQLALFEPANSVVYKVARKIAIKSTDKIYYDWCNKDQSTMQLFLDFKSTNFENMKHAVINTDASLIAVVGHHAKVYKTDGQPLPELHGHTDVINYCSFNSDGSRLATASEDNTVKVFKIVESLTSSGNYTGKRLSAPTLDVKDDAVITFKEHESPVICCAFSPDDEYIISCDIEYTYVWQINPQNWFNRCKKQPPNPKTPFNFCCFNNNGDLFAAASYNTIQVWDFETEILKTTINYGDFNINRFCFSPDDAKVLSISDNFVTECDVKSGNDKLVISTGPKKDYVLCSICVNDSYIACGTTKGSVIVISRETKTVVKNLRGHNRDVVNVAFSKDGKRLFSASSKAYILHDASHLTNSPLVSFEGTMSAHMDKELVVAASNYFNCVEVRKGLEGELDTSSEPEANEITACTLSNDCSKVFYGTKNGDVKVFNIVTKESVKLLPKHKGKVNYILASKHDSTLFTCSEDNTIHIRRENQETLILKGHTQSVLMCVEFQKSKKLVSCSKDGSLRVWNTETGELILPITEGHGNQDVRFCDLSRDEDLLASASADETIKIWSSCNGELKKTFKVKNVVNSAVRCCRFSPVNKILVSGHDNGNLVLWHLQGSQEEEILATHDSVVYDIRFSDDKSGQFLSLSSGIKLWSGSAQLLQTIILPSSYMGVDPPCLWSSPDFRVMVVVHNSVLYILKKFE
ncbi:hypothetical protein JTE90_027984 [Oedothorax gibbosus]|uniref:Apoptotic protease-activating factor 1 n=1 Tax=Oedothorax gibbosus TaxID=931172 RepID=A0AAV6VHT8_9ARAC|nr:hypothetical protein JTE90_027984 [Oedothorax gibbosus]